MLIFAISMAIDLKILHQISTYWDWTMLLIISLVPEDDGLFLNGDKAIMFVL